MKNIFLALIALVLIGLYFAWGYVEAIYLTGVPKELRQEYIQIPTGSSFEDVAALLENNGFLENPKGFAWLAEKMNYKKAEMRAGRYKIAPGMTNRELVQHLRGGKQEPVKVILNNERLPEDVAGKVAQFIEADSLSLLAAFQSDATLKNLGLSPATLMTVFIPNTYEFFWNTNAEGFLERMKKEHKRFWESEGRLEKAKKLGLTPEEVYTVASIVESETNYGPEKRTIAGVYLNRVKIGMKLQADPTCKFAARDFAAKRVTNFHTGFDSPYNTYMYAGLPPGPICMASIPSIEAVLNPEQHDYLYFCAKPDQSGQHAFAATLEGHNVNVEKFRVFQRTVLQQF